MIWPDPEAFGRAADGAGTIWPDPEAFGQVRSGWRVAEAVCGGWRLRFGPPLRGAATPRKRPEQPGTHGGRRPNAGGSGQIVPAEARAKAQRPRTLDPRILTDLG